MAITNEQLEHWFLYHAPQPGQPEAYAHLRQAALEFARVVVKLTPESADQTAAIRKLRECVFTANAAIACDGK